MKAIVTVVGKDAVGIIAGVCVELAKHNINVLDISQTVMQGYFTMMMVVDVSKSNAPITDLAQKLEEKGKEMQHICGSGIGGGTLGGLCHRLVGMERFGQIKKLALEGDLSQVNLTIKDITRDPAPTLDPTLTAANFGNLAEDATPADLALGVVNMVLEAIGTMTVLACKCCDTKTVILTGSVTTLDQARPNFEKFESLYGIHYIIPENATFATAIGAGLYSLQTEPLA